MRVKSYPDQILFEKVEPANGNRALHSREAIEPGTTVARFEVAALLCEPTRHTIQCSASEHMLVTPNFVQFINHGCDPNVELDTKEMHIKAIRRINPGEEIVYFYPSTEWSMAEPFRCHCKSPRCLGQIRGAAYLQLDVLANYHLSDHILELLAKRCGVSSAKA